MRALFRKIGAELGFERFHPHALRHNFASKMHLADVPLDVIQHQLGHAELSVTGVYLRHIDEDILFGSVANATIR